MLTHGINECMISDHFCHLCSEFISHFHFVDYSTTLGALPSPKQRYAISNHPTLPAAGNVSVQDHGGFSRGREGRFVVVGSNLMTLGSALGEIWSREGLGFDCKVAQHEMLETAFFRRLRKNSSGAAKRVPEGSGGTGRFRVEEVFSLKFLVFLGPENVPAQGLGAGAGWNARGFERARKVYTARLVEVFESFLSMGRD